MSVEYRVIKCSSDDLESTLNKYANEICTLESILAEQHVDVHDRAITEYNLVFSGVNLQF